VIYVGLLVIHIRYGYAQLIAQVVVVIDKTGPYVDIFPWTFEVVNEFAERYNLKLLEFKREPAELGRLFFVYQKLES